VPLGASASSSLPHENPAPIRTAAKLAQAHNRFIQHLDHATISKSAAALIQ
jgi:hypothetical protein